MRLLRTNQPMLNLVELLALAGISGWVGVLELLRI